MARGLEDPAAPQSPVSLMESWGVVVCGEAEIWMQRPRAAPECVWLSRFPNVCGNFPYSPQNLTPQLFFPPSLSMHLLFAPTVIFAHSLIFQCFEGLSSSIAFLP